jgi:hypothetical protein
MKGCEEEKRRASAFDPGGLTFFVQGCEGRLNVEWMDTGQSDKSRVARHMVIRGALIYTEDFGWPFRRRRER